MAIAVGLLKTLLELERSKKSGALDVRGSGARVRIFVEDGAIVHADEGTISETLGRLLLREKVLAQAQYDAALEHMAALRAKGTRRRLGEVLLETGALTKAQLDAALSAQVQKKVVRAIGWGASSFRFVECHGALELTTRFPTSLEPLVLAALRVAPEESIDELLDLALTRYPVLRGDGTASGGAARAETLARVDAFAFPPAERAFALGLDGGRTSAEILGETTDGVAPGVVLAALLLTDCLDLDASARAPRAPAATKRPAIRRVAKGPPSIPPRSKTPLSVRAPTVEEREHALEVAARLKAAKEAKRSVPPPPKVGELAVWKPEPSTGRLLAEKAFQAGKAHVRANDMAAAAAELRRAATLFPAIEYELWAAWTEMRADKAGEASHVASVRALAEKAIEEDASLGFAYFVLGHLALRAFDAPRARELFAKARALDPASSTEAKDVRLREARDAEAAKDDAPPAAEASPPERSSGASPEPVAREAAPAPAPPRARPLVIAAACAAVVAIGAWSAARRSAPPPPAEVPPAPSEMPVAATSLEPAPEPAIDAAADDDAEAVLSLDEDDLAEADSAAADTTPPDGAHGELLFPRAAEGHRVFVDGELAGEPPGRIVVRCGKRAVKVGSEGREQALEVPCGGRLDVAYP